LRLTRRSDATAQALDFCAYIKVIRSEISIAGTRTPSS
jgi:hypothetical protein